MVARIAEHDPKRLFKRNRSMLSMTPEELHRMATEPIKKKKSALGSAGTR